MTKITADTATRLNYHDGMFLTSGLMSTEQHYFLNQLALQNQYLYNAGVLDGLAPKLQNNSVVVASGAAFDGNGHLLLLPDAGANVLSVPAANASPTYVYLLYPQLSGATQDTLNFSAQLQVSDQDPLPGQSVLLAEVAHTNGVISTVTDKRTAVTSKIKSQAVNSLYGSATIAGASLPQLNATHTQTITFLAADTPAFTQTPKVVVSLQSAEAETAGDYTLAVVGSNTNGFQLTISCHASPQTSVDSLVVNWQAFIEGGNS
jgi:H-type lectin domain.